MASMEFIIEGDVAVKVTVTEVDGNLVFDLHVIQEGEDGYTGEDCPEKEEDEDEDEEDGGDEDKDKNKDSDEPEPVPSGGDEPDEH